MRQALIVWENFQIISIKLFWKRLGCYLKVIHLILIIFNFRLRFFSYPLFTISVHQIGMNKQVISVCC